MGNQMTGDRSESRKRLIAQPPTSNKFENAFQLEEKISVKKAAEKLGWEPRDILIAFRDGKLELIRLKHHREKGAFWELVSREAMGWALARKLPWLPTQNHPVKGWIKGALSPTIDLFDDIFLTEKTLQKLLASNKTSPLSKSSGKIIVSHWKVKRARIVSLALDALKNPVDEYKNVVRDKKGKPVASALLRMMREYPGQWELPQGKGFGDGNILVSIRNAIHKHEIE